ncbi:MAG: hypothetical protein KDD58_01825 [Bdellovibrionales bacterium]|nr:hypothetical protein [Bdellovibrionales bacterium]
MKIHVMFSVDWEGTSLIEDNLLAMRELSNEFPHIPRIQFLNPAHFISSENWDATSAKELVPLGISSKDEIGLHIHARQRLIEAANVKFRNRPSFFGGESVNFLGEYGGDVPITSYTVDELDKIIKYSLKILAQNGFHNIQSFRAGGWCANEKVYEALLKNNIIADSSPVPASLVANRYPNTYLHTLAEELWSDTTTLSYPYLKTINGSQIKVFPNNCCLADYVSFEQAQEIYQSCVKNASDEKKNAYFHYGWHQETLAVAHRPQKDGSFPIKTTAYFKRVHKLMTYLTRESKKGNCEIIFSLINKMI